MQCNVPRQAILSLNTHRSCWAGAPAACPPPGRELRAQPPRTSSSQARGPPLALRFPHPPPTHLPPCVASEHQQQLVLLHWQVHPPVAPLVPSSFPLVPRVLIRKPPGQLLKIATWREDTWSAAQWGQVRSAAVAGWCSVMLDGLVEDCKSYESLESNRGTQQKVAESVQVCIVLCCHR